MFLHSEIDRSWKYVAKTRLTMAYVPHFLLSSSTGWRSAMQAVKPLFRMRAHSSRWACEARESRDAALLASSAHFDTHRKSLSSARSTGIAHRPGVSAANRRKKALADACKASAARCHDSAGLRERELGPKSSAPHRTYNPHTSLHPDGTREAYSNACTTGTDGSATVAMTRRTLLECSENTRAIARPS